MVLIIIPSRTDGLVTMKSSVQAVVVSLVLAVLPFAAVCDAADLAARAKYGASPHSDSGDCSLCHVAAPEKLRSWFAFTSTKREMKDGPVEVCQKCHGPGFGHATGQTTSLNRAKLPLAADGTITCATTCHQMHIHTDDPQQTFYQLRLPADALCLSCHDK